MNDEQTIVELRRAVDAVARDHRLDPGTAEAAWTAARARRPRGRMLAAVAASVAVTAGAATALAVWADRSDSHHAAGPGSACAANETDDALPTWARAGFSPDAIRTPHVMGTHGRIVAIPFVGLRVHQPAGTNNKVLWVAKTGFGPLHIRAALEGTSQTVTRVLPNGPGPSYVDMPAAGCWLMDLSWDGQHDSVALVYSP